MTNGSKHHRSRKGPSVGRLDLGSPATAVAFRAAAKAYTKEATKSKETAIATLHREGILTKRGNFTKPYSAKG